MDRDPQENILDPVERVSPSTGHANTGTADDDRARVHRARQKRGTEAPADDRHIAPEGDKAPGRT